MKLLETGLDGVFLVETDPLPDERGWFIKTFHFDTFANSGISPTFKESYYSISAKNVIRGMHFQVPPQEHSKLVYVTSGSIIDVIVDIRKKSPTFGKYVLINLSSENRNAVYIEQGFAHGFASLEHGTCVTYLQTTSYSPMHDRGIRFDSFGMNWEIEHPIISSRDSGFPRLDDFASPFIYNK